MTEYTREEEDLMLAHDNKQRSTISKLKQQREELLEALKTSQTAIDYTIDVCGQRNGMIERAKKENAEIIKRIEAEK